MAAPGQPLRICFVGVPGAGKSGCARAVEAWLKQRGVSVVLCEEPLGEWKNLLTQFYEDPEAQAAALESQTLSARFCAIQRVERLAADSAARVIVHDAHFISNRMYVDGGNKLHGATRAAWEREFEEACNRVPALDLVVHLRALPVIALARVKLDIARSAGEKNFGLDYMLKLQAALDAALVGAQNTVTVDASGEFHAVVHYVTQHIDAHMAADGQTNALARALSHPLARARNVASPLVIVVRGIMGSGKSTLVHELGKALARERVKRGSRDDASVGAENTWKSIIIPEPSFDSTLRDYYAAPSQTAFSFQMAALQQRLWTLSRVDPESWEQEPLVLVRDGDSRVDRMFALARYNCGHMNLFQHSEYLSAFQLVEDAEPKPDIVVMMDTSPREALARIRARARPGEDSVTFGYLLELEAAHRELSSACVRVVAPEKAMYVDIPSALPSQKAAALILSKIGPAP